MILDTDNLTLTENGRAARITPQMSLILQALTPTLVTHGREIITFVWPDGAIRAPDNALKTQISCLRERIRLADMAPLIETLERRGYILTRPIAIRGGKKHVRLLVSVVQLMRDLTKDHPRRVPAMLVMNAIDGAMA